MLQSSDVKHLDCVYLLLKPRNSPEEQEEECGASTKMIFVSAAL